MKNSKKATEAYLFLGLTLALSWFVFWGPLALFKITAFSFVSDVKGPWWAIALFITGDYAPSLLGIFLAIIYLAGGRNLGPYIFAHVLINIVVEPWLMLSAVSGKWSTQQAFTADLRPAQ